MQGVVKNKNDKGFGFITPEDGSKDLFFHANDLVGITFDEVQRGDAVTFEVEDSQKGPKATKVSVSGGSSSYEDEA